MGFSVIPKSIGGVSVNSALGPLAALFRNDKIDNLVFPSDLGSNPAMGHAVVFQAYDITSGLQRSATELLNADLFSAVRNDIQTLGKLNKSDISFLDKVKESAKSVFGGGTASIASQGFATAGSFFTAPAYGQQRKGPPLSTISLFMPESVTVNYNSSYSDVSMTELLGVPGVVGNAVSDLIDAYKNGAKDMITPYAIGALGRAAANYTDNRTIGQAVTQAFGVVSNPQLQLLYRGVDLRSFQLEFVLTPKSANEAEKVKQICDSFTFFSLPNIAGGQTGSSGQYLNPPQLFSVQFRFLGRNDIVGNISNVISSALTNSGLGFFTSASKINNGTEAKLFTVKDCVLENVSIDYTPNGFATYNDGYPVQTRLTLSFKETQMVTKEHFAGTAISNNYASKTTNAYQNLSSRAEYEAAARSLGDWREP